MNIEEKKLVKKGTKHVKPKPYPGLTITKEFQQSANFITGFTGCGQKLPVLLEFRTKTIIQKGELVVVE